MFTLGGDFRWGEPKPSKLKAEQVEKVYSRLAARFQWCFQNPMSCSKK